MNAVGVIWKVLREAEEKMANRSGKAKAFHRSSDAVLAWICYGFVYFGSQMHHDHNAEWLVAEELLWSLEASVSVSFLTEDGGDTGFQAKRRSQITGSRPQRHCREDLQRME